MKKLLVALLSLCLLLSCFVGCSSLSDGDGTESTETQTEAREVIEGLSGEGSEKSPYLITKVDDLVLLATITNAQSNASTCKNVYFRLEQDLDLGGMEWLPIGGCFSGHFDGNGHTISNFKMTNATKAAEVRINSNMTAYANIGLFGLVYEGSISDLTVDGCTVQMTEKSTNYACLAGGLYNSTMTGCKVTGGTIQISNELRETQIGGLVGSADASSITDCEAAVTITLKRAAEFNDRDAMYVGGLVGEFLSNAKNDPDNYVTIENCRASGTITVENLNSSVYTGGIAGSAYEVRGSSFDGTITSATEQQNAAGYDYVGGIAGRLTNAEGCSAKGTFTARTYGYPSVGGITATLSSGTVKNCSFVGEVEANAKTFDCHAGGIVAELKTDGWVESCFAAGTIRGLASYAGRSCTGNAGGIVGTSNTDMTVKNCLSVGSVSASGSMASAASITGRRMFGADADATKHGFFNCYTGMSTAGGAERVAVHGTAATPDQLNTPSFYTDTLGWSADAWNIGTPNMENKIYPTVK